MASCVINISVKKFLKSDNFSLSYDQKCPGCYFPNTVYLLYRPIIYFMLSSRYFPVLHKTQDTEYIYFRIPL